MGPTSLRDTDGSGDVATDEAAAAGVASVLASFIPGVTATVVGGAGGIASIIYGAEADTTYYDQYHSITIQNITEFSINIYVMLVT